MSEADTGKEDPASIAFEHPAHRTMRALRVLVEGVNPDKLGHSIYPLWLRRVERLAERLVRECKDGR